MPSDPPLRHQQHQQQRQLPISQYLNKVMGSIKHTIASNEKIPDGIQVTEENLEEVITVYSKVLFELWKDDGKESFLAFKALSCLLQEALELSQADNQTFCKMMDILQDRALVFLKSALPSIIDSDMLRASNYVDVLLTNLALYFVSSGRNLLSELIKHAPYFSGFYLCEHSKRFEELFCFIHSNEQKRYDEQSKTHEIVVIPHYLCCMHFPSRKIIVSNAPPVKLRKRSLLCSQKYTCDVSAGGLVSGIKPSLQQSDVWVSYLDTSLFGLDRVPQDMVPQIIRNSVRFRPTYKRSTSLTRQSSFDRRESRDISDSRDSSSDDEKEIYSKLQDFLWEKAENDYMSLQKRLDSFAETNFTINPLVILKDDHTAFYNGISNGLFWPAFHNLPQYIIADYQNSDSRQLHDDWLKYVKVNFHFAIHTARTCRSQDFIWLHDYHLFLVGLILRCLNPSLHSAFFLHIPFRLTHHFMSQFFEQGQAVMRGLLGFKQVGFQTSRDCRHFIDFVTYYYPQAVVAAKPGKCAAFTVSYCGWVTDVGTFPISVKTEALLEIANSDTTVKTSATMRKRIMQGQQDDVGKLFLSIERFDYTKGIVERLHAIRRYFELYADRRGRDVFYQVAAESRGDVSSYQSYQQQVCQLAEGINRDFGSAQWQPVIIDRKNHPQEEVVQLYQASDVIVVTPIADGMNLVIKEAVLCNPAAVFVLSTGAGAENQLYDAGLSQCYIRIDDIKVVDSFAEALRTAVDTSKRVAIENGERMAAFVRSHDIQHWVHSYTDPSWTQAVIQKPPASEFNVQQLIEQLQCKRRTGVRCLLKSEYVGKDYEISFRNVLATLHENHYKGNKLEMGLKIDQGLINSFSMNTTSETLQEVHQHCSGISEHDFNDELARLLHFVDQIDFVDLLLVQYEGVLAWKEFHGDFVPLQTMTSGFLFSLFMARTALNTLMWSIYPLDALEAATTFPMELVITAADMGRQGRIKHDRSLRVDDSFLARVAHEEKSKAKPKVLIICEDLLISQFLSLLPDIDSQYEYSVIAIAPCRSEVSGNVCYVTAREVLADMMAYRSLKTVKISS